MYIAQEGTYPLNLPMTYPAEPVNGVLIAGGDAPGSHSPGFCYPDRLADEIGVKAGKYIVADRIDGLVRAGEKAKALSRLQKMIESRTRAALYLMDRQPWDLLMVLFTASDSAQHYFWENLAGGPYQNAILTVFRHLDAALGELLAKAGDGTTTIVLSDHGFGELVVTAEFLNDFLSELGLLRYRARSDSRTRLLRQMFAQLEKTLSDRAKAWLLQRFPRLRGLRGMVLGGIDWSTTRAFNLVGSSQIWINLRGHYPAGIVSPGQEYEDIVSLIQRALTEAIDPTSGQPAVKAVHRQTDLYHGPFLDQAPDLLVEWADEPARSGLAWNGDERQVVTIRKAAYRPFLINGGHRKMGIFVAAGAPFRTGTTIEGATLYDIAPTLLYLMDQPIPTNLDGQLLSNAMNERWLQTQPPRFTEEDQDSFSGPAVSMPTKEEDTVMGRLRALGYVE